MKFAFDREPVFVREGDPIARHLEERYLKCPVMFLGLSLAGTRYHAPNEIRLEQASGRLIASRQSLEEVSALSVKAHHAGRGDLR